MITEDNTIIIIIIDAIAEKTFLLYFIISEKAEESDKTIPIDIKIKQKGFKE